MPLYEYQCDSCGNRFETIVKFSDAPIETCPKCGGHVHKLMSAPAFTFKGSGWYITDYAKKDSSASSSEKSEKSEKSSASDSGDSAKTDEKKADGGKTDAAPAKTESASPAKPSSKD